MLIAKIIVIKTTQIVHEDLHPFSITFVNQFFAFISAYIIIPPLLIVTNICIYSTLGFTCFMPFYMSCSLVLDIETHFKEVALSVIPLNLIPLKNDIATTNTFLTNPNIFIAYYSFSLNIINCNSIIINTKIINITI